MTVRNLIEKLSNLDPELLVLVSGYENGFEVLDEVKEINVSKNTYVDKNGKLPWWDGEFDISKGGGSIKAVLLPRNCYSKYKN